MLRTLAILFGIIFIFIGVIGFLPTFTQDGILFHFFEVNGIQNLAHIVTGVMAIMAATSLKYTRLYFQIFGIIYLLVALIGLYRHGNLFIMSVNLADNILNILFGALSIYLGYFFKKRIY